MRCQERKERKRVEAEQFEREREIQRMVGKDRISWVGDFILDLSLISLKIKNSNNYGIFRLSSNVC